MRYDPTTSALTHPEKQPPLGPDWPWNEAALLAECARLAYIRFEADRKAEATLKTALAAFGYDNFAGFVDGKNDTQAFAVVSATRTALVVFRGTQSDSPRDIWNDLRFLPTNWAGKGNVHKGFWASLQGVLRRIQVWLDNERPTRLIVTGHSLGAAQAALLAGIREEAELVTFGSPRVGDPEFAASFSGRKMERYVDCLDFVTRVPPLIFTHLDGLQYIDRHGKVHSGGLSVAGEIADRSAAAASYVRLLSPQNCLSRDLADHAPINYVSALLGVRTEY